MPPNDYAQVKENCWADDTPGNCTIVKDSVQYYILKPKVMYPKVLSVSKIRVVCNKPCSDSLDCSGGGVCSIAGYCDSKKIVSCSLGTANCNNQSCSVPATKSANEAYACEWECASGKGDGSVCKWNDKHACIQPTDCLSGNCNFAGYCGEFIDCSNGTQNCNDKLCVTPSNKSVGEAYSCVLECATGAGKGGVCDYNITAKLKTLAFIVLIFAVAYAIYLKWNQRNVLNETSEKQKKMIEESERKVANAEMKLQFYGPQMDILETEINSKKEQSQDILIRNERQKQELQERIDEQNQLIAHEKKEWAKLKPFPDGNANGRLVISNPFLGGYLCFYQKGLDLKDYPIGKLLHRWVWTKHHGRKPMPGSHIHHKDENKFNNEISNLEEIKGGEEEHYGIHRYGRHLKE